MYVSQNRPQQLLSIINYYNTDNQYLILEVGKIVPRREVAGSDGESFDKLDKPPSIWSWTKQVLNAHVCALHHGEKRVRIFILSCTRLGTQQSRGGGQYY